jgi:hypothetical protein
MHLGVGDLEPDVSDASGSGEPARFGYLDPGKVRAQSMPAAGGARREDGRITAAAPDVENILPVLDPRAGKQSAVSRLSIRSCRSRCSMNSRPLAPFQSSACSAFTATKPTLHRPESAIGAPSKRPIRVN